MGFTQGLLAALVADASDESVRGTAFGILRFGTGIMLLAASVLAEVLWDHYGAQATFLAGATVTAAAIVATVVLRLTRRLRTRSAGTLL